MHETESWEAKFLRDRQGKSMEGSHGNDHE